MNTLRVTYTYDALPEHLTFGEAHRLCRESTLERLDSFLRTRRDLIQGGRVPVLPTVPERSVKSTLAGHRHMWLTKEWPKFTVTLDGFDKFDWQNLTTFDPTRLLVILTVKRA